MHKVLVNYSLIINRIYSIFLCLWLIKKTDVQPRLNIGLSNCLFKFRGIILAYSLQPFL